MPNRKKVAIIMGSDSDWPVVKSACGVLKDFDVPFEAHILSAHRTPEAAAAFAKSARANGYGVIPVSYTHLDVYKRQVLSALLA